MPPKKSLADKLAETDPIARQTLEAIEAYLPEKRKQDRAAYLRNNPWEDPATVAQLNRAASKTTNKKRRLSTTTDSNYSSHSASRLPRRTPQAGFDNPQPHRAPSEDLNDLPGLRHSPYATDPRSAQPRHAPQASVAGLAQPRRAPQASADHRARLASTTARAGPAAEFLAFEVAQRTTASSSVHVTSIPGVATSETVDCVTSFNGTTTSHVLVPETVEGAPSSFTESLTSHVLVPETVEGAPSSFTESLTSHVLVPETVEGAPSSFTETLTSHVFGGENQTMVEETTEGVPSSVDDTYVFQVVVEETEEAVPSSIGAADTSPAPRPRGH